MDSAASELYSYFKVLVTKGFLELRKQVDQIMLVMEMLIDNNFRLPCFEGGKATIVEIRKRFMAEDTEQSAINKIKEIIIESEGNWRTYQYDR